MPKRKLPSEILKRAQEADLGRVFVVGKRKDGRFYASGSGPMFKHLEDLEQFIGGFYDGTNYEDLE